MYLVFSEGALRMETKAHFLILSTPSGTIDRDWVEYEGMYEGYIDCGCIQVYWLLIEDKLYKATHI